MDQEHHSYMWIQKTHMDDLRRPTYLYKDNIIMDIRNNLAFVVTGIVNACGSDILTTSQGIYISADINFLAKAYVNDTVISDLKSLTDLQLADEDYIKFEEEENLKKVSENDCKILELEIDRARAIDNQLFKVDLLRRKDIYLYTKFNQIYIPHCITIEEIKIPKNSSKCFRDLPIEFNIQEKFTKAFFTTNGIIRLVSEEVSCSVINKYYHIKDLNITIVAHENIYDN